MVSFRPVSTVYTKHHFMYNIATLNLLAALLLLSACGQNAPAGSDERPEQESPAPETPVSEDDLILRLSLELVADPQTRDQQEQNAIVNYAIDNLLDIRRTSSGLYYQILQTGQGDTLQWADRIRAHYRGYFLDGQEFDSSYRRDKPMDFYIGNMIPGWNEGLQLLQVGSKARLLIPSRLGYGAEGLKNGAEYLVPPDQVLIFEVEVLRKLS